MALVSKRTLVFGIGLAIGIGLVDWIGYQELNVVKLMVAGIVGGGAYHYILKLQGRDKNN